MAKKIGAVFDMDGVIVHSNPAHKEIIKEFCKKHQQEVSDKFLTERVYGRTNKEWIPEVFGEMSLANAEELADEKEQMFRDQFHPRAAAIPGITDFLKLLHQKKIPCVVATSAPSANAEFILSELDIKKYFSATLDSSDVEKGKPEPQIYLKAAETLGLPSSDCIVFEDSLAGVEAGLRAGSKVVGITSTHSEDELSNCSLVINNFNELSYGNLEKIIG